VTIPVNQLQDVNKITLSLKNYSTILSHAKLTIRALSQLIKIATPHF